MSSTPLLALVQPPPAAEQLYPCTGCQAQLPRSAFGRDVSGPEGRRRTCRQCDDVGSIAAPVVAALKRSFGRLPAGPVDRIAVLMALRQEVSLAVEKDDPGLSNAMAAHDLALISILTAAAARVPVDPRAADRARLEAEIADRQRQLEALR